MCSLHYDCKAKFVCNQCGFLCKQEDEANTTHQLIQLNQHSEHYYQVVSNQQKVIAEISMRLSLEQHINDFIIETLKFTQSLLANEVDKIDDTPLPHLQLSKFRTLYYLTA